MITFKEPWEAPINSRALEVQLSSELHCSHYLHKFKNCMKAIGKKIDNDDVIFEIREFGFVIVHLTWAEQTTNKYPVYKMLPREEMVQATIENDHKKYINA